MEEKSDLVDHVWKRSMSTSLKGNQNNRHRITLEIKTFDGFKIYTMFKSSNQSSIDIDSM